MKTNVTVNVKVVVTVSHPDSAVESFVESLAISQVEDSLASDKKIEVRKMDANCEGPIVG